MPSSKTPMGKSLRALKLWTAVKCSACTRLLVVLWPNGKLSGLEVENFRLEPWLAHCVVFLDMIHNSHNAALHPGVLKDGRKLGGWGGLALHAFLFFP